MYYTDLLSDLSYQKKHKFIHTYMHTHAYQRTYRPNASVWANACLDFSKNEVEESNFWLYEDSFVCDCKLLLIIILCDN